MVSAPPLDRITVGEAVTRYLRNVERAVTGESLSETTAAYYRRDLAEFADLAGRDTVLDDLTSENLDDILLTYASKPDGRFSSPDSSRTRSPGTQARFRQSFARMFNEAVTRGWVEHNPVPQMVVKPRQAPLKNAARKALPESAANALLDVPANRKARSGMALTLRDTFILMLLVEAGPRVSEVCQANQADLERRDDGTYRLHVVGKGRKDRRVPMSQATWDAYQAYLQHERPKPAPRVKKVDGLDVETVGADDAEVALLLTWRGRRMTPRDVQLMVKRACKHLPAEVRREVTPHGLRHTAATLLLTSGAADISTVREMLGHESIATTGIYLDGVDNEMSRAVAMHPITSKTRTPAAAVLVDDPETQTS